MFQVDITTKTSSCMYIYDIENRVIVRYLFSNFFCVKYLPPLSMNCICKSVLYSRLIGTFINVLRYVSEYFPFPFILQSIILCLSSYIKHNVQSIQRHLLCAIHCFGGKRYVLCDRRILRRSISTRSLRDSLNLHISARQFDH